MMVVQMFLQMIVENSLVLSRKMQLHISLGTSRKNPLALWILSNVTRRSEQALATSARGDFSLNRALPFTELPFLPHLSNEAVFVKLLKALNGIMCRYKMALWTQKPFLSVRGLDT